MEGLPIGEVIRKARKVHRLNQGELAARSSMSIPTIVNVERGHVMPTIATLVALGKGLGVSASRLLEEAELLARGTAMGTACAEGDDHEQEDKVLDTHVDSVVGLAAGSARA